MKVFRGLFKKKDEHEIIDARYNQLINRIRILEDRVKYLEKRISYLEKQYHRLFTVK